MKIVAIIPIKLNSKRLPHKNIKEFYDGTPLIHFIQKTCISSKYINEVYLYCSDDIDKKYVIDGVDLLKRPKFLDGDECNANDIIKTFMNDIDADIYVNAHTTSPFAKVETIDDCIEKVMSGQYDSSFCAENIKTFMWMNNKPINFNPNKFPRTQDLPDIFAETSIAYVFTKNTFIKYNRRLGVKPYIKEVDKIEAIDIDNLIDFEIANAVYKEVIK